MDQKTRMIIVAAIAIMFIGTTVACSSNNTNKSSSTSTSENTETKKEEKKTSLENLAGFTFSHVQEVDDGSAIYSYRPSSDNDFSVTVAIGNKKFLTHEGSATYTVEKGIKPIENIDVKVAYSEEYEHNGTILSEAYESLAFDFENGGKYYSGEVSSLKGEPSKDKLMEILTKFVIAIENK